VNLHSFWSSSLLTAVLLILKTVETCLEVLVGVVTGSLLAASRYLVAAVFCQCRVLCFTTGLPAGYPFCSICGVVSFVSGIRVLGLGPFPF